MTNAPQGMGGPEPFNGTGTPGPEASALAEQTLPSDLAAGNRVAPTSPENTQEAAGSLLAQAPNTSTPEYPSSPSTPFDERGLFRLLEIILAVTAVGTGIVAVLLRLRANS
jgi:hypothetical protein